MDKTLRILILEDRPSDADLMEFELKEAGLTFISKRVMTEDAFVRELEQFCPDLILSDYDLPQYTGFLALVEAKSKCPDIPFILVTGAIGEDRAIEILTHGAKDYVMKSRLHRLVPAVQRALAEAEEHKARQKAEEELRQAHQTLEKQVEKRTAELQAEIAERKKMEETLRESEERFKVIASSTPDHLVVQDRELRYSLVVNPQLGLTEQDMIGKTDYDILSKDDAEKLTKIKRHVLEMGTSVHLEIPLISLEGEQQFFDGFYVPTLNAEGKVNSLIGYFRNVTERKRTEERIAKLTRLYAALSRVNETIIRVRDVESLYHEVCRIVSEEGGFPLVWIGQVKGQQVVPAAWYGPASDYVKEIKVETSGKLGKGPTGTSIREDWAVINDDFVTNPATSPWREPAGRYGFRASAAFPLRRQGKTIASLTLYALDPGVFDAEQVGLLESLSADISYALDALDHEQLRDRAEEALRESEDKFAGLYSSMVEGVALHKIIYESSGQSVDYIISDVNPSYESITGLRKEMIVGKRATEVYGTTEAPFLEVYARVAFWGKPEIFEAYFPPMRKYFAISAFSPAKGQFATVFQDISERKQAEEELKKRTAQLEELNKELESFSYSVSHDLRAPLRAIDGYARLILKKQGDNFDEDTLNKFNVIRSSTHMMGQLIDDLLTFSRLGRKHISMSRLDMDTLIRDAWKELEVINPDRSMRLTVKNIPEGYGDRALIKQVCINLLSNAVKFTKYRDAAHIEAGGSIDGDENVYFVKDNGVGFDMAYYDKLFGVFQRLHSSEDFEGTGVGLATVQRIIHRHGGRVWAEGKADEGACFYFSLSRQEESIK